MQNIILCNSPDFHSTWEETHEEGIKCISNSCGNVSTQLNVWPKYLWQAGSLHVHKFQLQGRELRILLPPKFHFTTISPPAATETTSQMLWFINGFHQLTM